MALKFSIPRGVIYHSIYEDVKWLFKSTYVDLSEQHTISLMEQSFASNNNNKYCVAFPFARTAIYFSLKYKKLPQGAEIIMPPITIKGILDVVLELGLKPVFVDIDPDTLCFNCDQFQEKINHNTKAAIFTYLFGIVPNLGELTKIARKHGLYIIEDFSQCLNGEFQGNKVGGFGDVAVYSASSIKTFDTYGGGLLVTNNPQMHDAMRLAQASLEKPSRKVLIKKIITNLVRNLVTNKLLFSVIFFHLLRLINFIKPNTYLNQTGGREKSMLKTLPREWFQSYTSLQAEVGLSMLDRVSIEDRKRVSNVIHLKANITNKFISFPKGVDETKNVYWQLVAYITDIDDVQRKVQHYGVDTARSSLLQVSNLKAYPYQEHTPNANKLCESGYFVPSYPSLTGSELNKVVQAFNQLAVKAE